MTQKIQVTSADGVEGCLIFVGGEERFKFRVYRPDGEFTDYRIVHSDLFVKIVDASACFYTKGEEHILDYDPATLGIVFA